MVECPRSGCIETTVFFSMRKYFSLLLLICLLFISCAGVPRQQELDTASYVPEAFDWEEVCPGVARFDFENAEVPLVYHAVKIDLSYVDAGAGQKETLELTCSRGERTSEFAARENCVAAVNATPFDKTGELVGLCREAGREISAPVERYAALALKYGEDGAGLDGRIFATQVDDEIKDFDYAFGGFFVVLEEGEVNTEFVRRYTSRTGAGLSADGKTLYLLVVEGEQPRKSIGLSYPQCGEIFLAMGCRNALEFDGGGSSDLCINGQSVMNYRVRRVQGNSFGFRVK